MHIQEFQKMMQRLYFHRDSERGLKGTFNWLMEEVEELREALEKGDRKEVEREFADVIAWLSSLANIVGVDLERRHWQNIKTDARSAERRLVHARFSSRAASVLSLFFPKCMAFCPAGGQFRLIPKVSSGE